MTSFTIYYYDLPVRTIQAPNRTAAVKQMGIYYGGMVGIRVVQS